MCESAVHSKPFYLDIDLETRSKILRHYDSLCCTFTV